MSQHDVRFELIMDAGNGAQKAGDILINSFAKTGRYVYIEPMIPAEISPPKRTKYSMSGVVIRLADYDITNIGSGTDLMLIEHEILLDRRLEDREYFPGSTVLLDMGDQAKNQDAYKAAMDKAVMLGVNLIPFAMDDAAKKTMADLGGNGKNMFYLGVLAKVFSMPKDLLIQEIRSTFKKLSEEKLVLNLSIFESGYICAESFNQISYDIKANPLEGEKVLLDGNTALALGIIDAGYKVYCGYPITPASSIMHSLAKLLPQYGGFIHQAEDEISAIGAAIGCYYTGTPSITGTSGPGLSLKQEFIGLATATETPLVVIDVQRGGPSTGLPTKNEQSDLFAAVFGCHGDNTKVVISVANVIDCFYVAHIARYLTETLRLPVIILSDYMTSVSYKVLKKPVLNEMNTADDVAQLVFDRFRLKRFDGPIEMVKDNQSNPGDAGLMRRVTGLNADANSQISYTADSAIRSHAVRNAKLDAVRNVMLEPERFGADSGDLLVVGWGSSRGAIEEAIQACEKEGLSVGGIHLKIVYPLPPMMGDIFKKYKKVITVEMAFGDAHKPAPLAMLLRAETLVDVVSAIAEPSGRPLKPAHIVSKAKEIIHG
jgi:2-oxoglutarate/2-oxoacid ferredoxin oxidoreductase subunit alpha